MFRCVFSFLQAIPQLLWCRLPLVVRVLVPLWLLSPSLTEFFFFKKNNRETSSSKFGYAMRRSPSFS